jgi:protein phosphatase PTC1
MEDTHAYLYNFLSTPAPVLGSDSGSKSIASIPESTSTVSESASSQNLETDNGYFAIFDGHAGTFAADWCGKKLHLLLEDTIRKNPNKAIPELLDRTFTSVDQQLEKLPLKNSGCTAVIAVLRWEDRVPNSQSATGSSLFAPAAVAAAKAASESANSQQSAAVPDEPTPTQQTPPVDASAAAVASNDQPQPLTQGKTEQATATEVKLRETATRQRVLYTANVGDARIVLCRNGRALRLSYDHKGSDENEGRRVANAGGLILNNRVNGVLAVTRALGDAYMKDLVTGHPYTTETVIQPDQDEFLILACDGLWDVCTDQEAVDIVRSTQDPQLASKQLVDHALARFSTDNLSCMIVRFDKEALKQRRAEAGMGVDGDSQHADGQQTSEATKIVEQAKKGNVEAAGGTSSIPSEVSNAEPTAKVVEMQNVKEEPSAEDEAANNDQKPDAQANE